MSHGFGTLDELGDGYGFRKVRQALGVDAFGVNGIVYPPGQEGFLHYHDEPGRAVLRPLGHGALRGRGRGAELGPGGLVHVSSTTPRKVSNVGDDDLVMLVIGGKGGYVDRDGHMVDDADVERRASFGSGASYRASGQTALSGGGSPGASRSAAPASAKTTTESQWMPITSVCSPSTATAATDAASQGERRRSAQNSAASHPTKAAQPRARPCRRRARCRSTRPPSA